MKQFTIVLFLIIQIQLQAMNPLRLNIINQNSAENRRAVYLTYSAEQKAAIWLDKLDQVIHYGGWTDEQLQLLTMMKNKITPIIFIEGSIQQTDWLKFYNQFEEAGITSFSKIVYGKIFVSLNDYSVDMTVTGSDPPSDCGCAIGSNFTCEWWIPGGSECAKSVCNPAPRGCGGLWNQVCNGNCVSGGVSGQQMIKDK